MGLLKKIFLNRVEANISKYGEAVQSWRTLKRAGSLSDEHLSPGSVSANELKQISEIYGKLSTYRKKIEFYQELVNSLN